ncbi:MAG: hypothetical protein E4H38_07190 [Gemmatimonadales bacterium]|nr:MAG: hypothetical protein E4H38_07190 [Gemmatimonadales bacterium]
MTDFPLTERLKGRVMLAEGPAIDGDLHLQPRVAWRDGPETVLEMLNRRDRFFAIGLPDGKASFVSKSQVAAVFHADDRSPDQVERQEGARPLAVKVMLVGGREIEGVVMSELPMGRGRALDFLNDKGDFFELVTSTGPVCVNRTLVRLVRPED